MAYVCFWLAILIHNYLEQHWTLKLVVSMTQCICKVCVTFVNMFYSPGRNNFLTTVIAVFSLNEEEAQMLSHPPSIPTFILIFHQNIFQKLFKDLSLSLPILSSVRPVSKMNWKLYRVNTRKIDTMTFGEQIR